MSKEYATSHYGEIYNRFLNLAINRFTWKNLPEGLSSRQMEKMLIENGMLMFFEDELNGMLCLPCMGVKTFNIYNEPIWFNVVGNQYNKTLAYDEGVIIRNNALGTGDVADLSIFAERLNEIEQTMDVNLIQQATPYIFLTDEKERLTIKNIFNQIREKKFAIFGNKNFGLKQSEVLLTQSPYLLDKLQAHKNSLMNELLTFLGINNNNIEKKERMLVDEVNANNDFILVNIDHMFDERERAVKEINEKFGLNIIVEKREVENIEPIYNDSETTDRGQL